MLVAAEAVVCAAYDHYSQRELRPLKGEEGAQ